MATLEELEEYFPELKTLLPELAKKYPGKRLKPVETAAGLAVLANSTRGDYLAYLEALGDGKPGAFDNLFLSMVVYPGKDEARAWLESYNAITRDPDVQQTIQILTGWKKEERQKK
jgi:hypothetical protein